MLARRGCFGPADGYLTETAQYPFSPGKQASPVARVVAWRPLLRGFRLCQRPPGPSMAFLKSLRQPHGSSCATLLRLDLLTPSGVRFYTKACPLLHPALVQPQSPVQVQPQNQDCRQDGGRAGCRAVGSCFDLPGNLLRSLVRITGSLWPPIHPAWLRSSSVTYRRVCALLAPRHAGASTLIVDPFILTRDLRGCFFP
jgi:hypothetical protein